MTSVLAVSCAGAPPKAAVPRAAKAGASPSAFDARSDVYDRFDARKDFLASREAKPDLYQADGRLTVLDQRRGKKRLDQAIGELTEAARKGGFADIGVLVALAAVQVERAGLAGAKRHPEDDLAEAGRNLQRALVIDERSVAAKSELALLYIARAKALAGAERSQNLERAMGICLTVIRENPMYAPIRNTAGLVHFELGDDAAAVRDFQVATTLDPHYLDAHANLAAILLSLHQFSDAQRSYDRALSVRQDEYELHFGRALALRGQLTESNFDEQVASIELELDRCKRLDPERPDAYYSEAILNDQFKSGIIKTMHDASKRAESLFDTFVAKAGERPEYATEVKLAKARLKELRSR
jgi:tetratricopeptide (TPR) repeat protein